MNKLALDIAAATSVSKGHRISDKPLSKEKLRIRVYCLLVMLDMLAITTTFGAMSAIYLGDPIHPHVRSMLAAVLPIYFLIALNSGAFTFRVLVGTRESLSSTISAILLTVAVVGLVAFYIRATNSFSRVLFLLGMGGSAVLICALRLMLARHMPRIFGGSPLAELLICDGVAPPTEVTMPVIDARAAGLEPSLDDPMMLDRLGRFCIDIDRVVVICSMERRPQWALALKGADVDVEILAPELDAIGTLGTGQLNGATTLTVALGPLSLRDRLLKRSLDLSIALATLPLLAPVMLLIALAIKLDSPGPVFFVQPRIGRGNRIFPMYKFRSMRTDLTDVHGSQLTSRGDARVTRVGSFIRRTSLDELPQLLNVLSGEMSIAGPRPHAMGALAGDALYWEVDHRYWHRHAIKPGLTGLAQIRGYRGNTVERSDLANRLQADLEYLSGWTVWRDIAIIFSTFRVLLHRNAF